MLRSAHVLLLVFLLIAGSVLVPSAAQAFERFTGPSLDVPVEQTEVDPEAAALVRRLMRRSELVPPHKVLGTISLVSMLVGQGVGIFNHVALSSGGLTREQATPTLMVHRLAVSTAVTSYFISGLLAWGMPGPDGTPRTKRFSSMHGGRRAHVALSIAHGLALATTVALGAVSSFATRDTAAWDATVTAHHVAAATTSLLIVFAVTIRAGG